MGKRKRYSAALQKEMQGYHNLLTYLNTQHVQDLSAGLIEAYTDAAQKQAAYAESLPNKSTEENLASACKKTRIAEGEDATSACQSAAPETADHSASFQSPPNNDSAQNTPSTKPAAKPTKPKRPKGKTIGADLPPLPQLPPRDPKIDRKLELWTAWPLMLSDVPVPEAEFEEEARVLALHEMRQQIKDEKAAGDAEGTDEEEDALMWDDDLLLPDDVSQLLGEQANTYLEQLLSAVAAHVRVVCDSMKDRRARLRFEDILDIARAYCPPGMRGRPQDDVKGQQMIDAIHRQMNPVFGPSRRRRGRVLDDAPLLRPSATEGLAPDPEAEHQAEDIPPPQDKVQKHSYLQMYRDTPRLEYEPSLVEAVPALDDRLRKRWKQPRGARARHDAYMAKKWGDQWTGPRPKVDD